MMKVCRCPVRSPGWGRLSTSEYPPTPHASTSTIARALLEIPVSSAPPAAPVAPCVCSVCRLQLSRLPLPAPGHLRLDQGTKSAPQRFA